MQSLNLYNFLFNFQYISTNNKDVLQRVCPNIYQYMSVKIQLTYNTILFLLFPNPN